MFFFSAVCELFTAYEAQCRESFLLVHQNQCSTVSGKSPTEGDYGQTKEGAEGGIERLDLSRVPGFSKPPVGRAVRFVAHRYFAP